MLLLLTQICASPAAGDGKCIDSVLTSSSSSPSSSSVQEVASDSPLKFQADVISSLVIDVALEPDTTKSEELARLTERHFLSHTPETAKGTRKNFLTRRCRVCHKNGPRKEVAYVCEQCPSHPALCPVACFKLYHTKDIGLLAAVIL